MHYFLNATLVVTEAFRGTVLLLEYLNTLASESVLPFFSWSVFALYINNLLFVIHTKIEKIQDKAQQLNESFSEMYKLLLCLVPISD